LGYKVYCEGGKTRHDLCLFEVQVSIDGVVSEAWFNMPIKDNKDCGILMDLFQALRDMKEMKANQFGSLEPRPECPTVQFWRIVAYGEKKLKQNPSYLTGVPRFLFCVKVVARDGNAYNVFVQVPFDNYGDADKLKSYFDVIATQPPTKAYRLMTERNYKERTCKTG
jgi:hypothetical protein